MKPPILNIADVEFRAWGHGADAPIPGLGEASPKFQAKIGDVAQRIGARKLGYGLVVVPPGKRAWPTHNHRVNEEAFFILEGEGEVRIGEERYPVRKGDFIANPPGDKTTAHQIVNTSQTEELRYIGISTRETPEIVEYPDSKKFAAAMLVPGPEGKPQLWRVLRHEGENAAYWDDE